MMPRPASAEQIEFDSSGGVVCTTIAQFYQTRPTVLAYVDFECTLTLSSVSKIFRNLRKKIRRKFSNLLRKKVVIF